ncbi:hypothetical protein ACH6EH_06580 [Paenibacillus sp. JSM ZJ436]|uniref:hypothetical protein n=1 Tax=Paenibacillus sp. JSM ZJ436 TaxID=3376190 RepID=UPI0037B39E55
MISNEQKISWKTAWLQFLCEINNVEHTGYERREELETKLATAGFQSFPLIPSVYTATGTTNNPNTTNNFSGSAFILPDPQITLSMKKSQKAIINGLVCLSTNSGTNNSARMTCLVYSINGGTSWTNLGTWMNATDLGNSIVPVTLNFAYTASADVNIIFGIRIANIDGTTIVTASNNQRSLTVTVF